jgi:Family of unknown function (DUF6444)
VRGPREAEAIYDPGREVGVEVLSHMDEQIRRLEERVARQDERIAELERKLNRSSRNSSAPPSSDRPNRPKRGKDRSGRKRGGQSGHERRGRDLLPACVVDEVIEHWRRAAHAIGPCASVLSDRGCRADVETPSLGWPATTGDGMLTIDYFRVTGLRYRMTREASIDDPTLECRTYRRGRLR